MSIFTPTKEALSHKCFLTFLLFILLGLCTSEAYAQTRTVYWDGWRNNDWNDWRNWSDGRVPDANTAVVIGGLGFTYSNQPELISGSDTEVYSLTIGGTGASGSAKAGELQVSVIAPGRFIVKNDVTIKEGGKLANFGSDVIVGGNWVNNNNNYSEGLVQTYRGNRITNTYYPTTEFSGNSKTVGGAYTNKFNHVTISGSITLDKPLTITPLSTTLSKLHVSGTLDPGLNLVSFTTAPSDGFVVDPGATIKVKAATFGLNYDRWPTEYAANSTIDYAASDRDQTISNEKAYGILQITGNTTKSLTGNTSILGSATVSELRVMSGTLDLQTFTLDRAIGAGGTLTIANGATMKIGGSGTFPSNYGTRNFGSSSTVEYYGAAQTVTNETYGNLKLSGSGTKTIPATALVIAGNFESSGSASYTAGNNITVSGNVDIGSGSTFSGSNRTITVGGNWTDNGTYNAGSSTVILNGSAKQIIRTSGTATFNHLQITGGTITTTANVTLSGDLTTSGAGALTQSSGTFTMSSNEAKSISGGNITFHNFASSGTGSTGTASSQIVNGDFTVNTGSTFTATGGTVQMAGITKQIVSSGMLTFHGLRVSGTIATANSFNVNSDFSGNGKLTATAGTVTFNGTSTFAGAHDLLNVTVNSGKSLTMVANANLGIAGELLTNGTLNVTANTPNTITYNGSLAQTVLSRTYHNIVLDRGGAKSVGGSLNVNGNLTINASSNLNASTFAHTILGNFINNGTFDTGTNSIVSFEGGAESSITGTITFKELKINKATGVGVTLNNDATANTLNMNSGFLRTGVNKITVLLERIGNGWVSGTIRRNHAFAANTSYAFNSPYTQILFTTASGVNDVSVTTSTGTVSNFPSASAINRTFSVAVNAGTYTGAKLQLQYEDAELNGNPESGLQFYKIMSGTWTSIGKDANDESQNWVSKNDIADLGDGNYTLSATTSVYQWVGTTNSAWDVAANWQDITSGSPAVAGRYPGSTDIVELGNVAAANQPNVTKSESIKGIRFNATASTALAIDAGANMSVLGNITAVGAGTNIVHSINTNAATASINVGGNLVLNDGSTGNNINLNIGNGTVAIAGDLDQTGASNITMGTGHLKLSGNYIYATTGTFTKGTGTVTYEGANAQAIGAAFYHHVIINKPSGVATLNALSGSVGGDVTVQSGTLAVPSGNLSFLGDFTQTGGVVNIGSSNVTVAGNWLKSGGTFEPGTSAVTLQGSSIKATTPLSFYNLIINKAANATLTIDNATIDNGIIVNNDLTLQGGILDLGAKTLNRSAVGGRFTINNDCKLLLSESNFPANYNNYTLDPSCTVEYNSSAQQNIKPVKYGHLTLKNGTSANPKKLIGATRTDGKLTIEGNAKLDGDGNTLTLGGDFEINTGGVFTAGATNNSGTLVIAKPTVAGRKQLLGNFDINNMLLEAETDYQLASGSLKIKGSFTNQGCIDAVTNTVIFEGDFLNTGILKSSGVAKFSGTNLQTIQLQAPIAGSVPHPTIPSLMVPPAVEFNGNIAPVLNSTAEPNFGKVTIANTDPAGIRATVNWTVNLDFNVAPNAKFNGGPYTHNFHTAILNSGTIESSGRLRFIPSGLAGLAAYPIKFGTSATAFQSTGTLEIGGTHVVALTGVVPATLNNVVISNTHAAGVSAQTVSADLPLYGTTWNFAGTLQVNSGAKFNAGTDTKYNLSGDILDNGTFNGADSEFTFLGSSCRVQGVGVTTLNKLTVATDANLTLKKNLAIKGDLLHNGSSFTVSEAEVSFVGNANSSISSGSSLNIEHLKIAKTSPTATVTLNADLASVFDIIVTGGVFDIASKSITMSESAPNTMMQVDDGATLKIESATAPEFTTYTLSENSTVEYYGANQAVKSMQYGNLILANTGTASFETGEALIAGVLTLTGGAGQTVIAPDKVTYNGSGAQSIAPINYKDLTLSNAGTKRFIAGATGISGALTTAETATLNAAGTNVTIDYNGAGDQNVFTTNYNNLTVSNSGVKLFSGVNGVAGALIVSDAAAPDLTTSESTINFNGTGAQTIPALDYNKILVSGRSNKSLGGDATVAKELRLADGLINTGSNKIILGNTATILEDEDNYVTGFVETSRLVTAGMLQDFGGVGMELTSPETLGPVTVTRETGRAAGTSGNSVERLFSFSNPGPNNRLNATLTYHYFDHELNGLDENDLVFYRSLDGKGWEQHGSAVSSPTSNRVGVTGVSNLNRMALGGGNSPLPVDLGYFRAEKRGGDAVLTWTTTVEEGNRGFGVEVSTDGKSYRELGFVSKGTGTSRVAVLYTFTDREAHKGGVRYYRLRQEDFDGRVSYYGPRALVFEGSREIHTIAYPNPFRDRLTVAVNAADGESVRVSLTDVSGRVVLEQAGVMESGVGSLTLDASGSRIPPGLYVATVEAAGDVHRIKVIKE